MRKLWWQRWFGPKFWNIRVRTVLEWGLILLMLALLAWLTMQHGR